jgi:hypothetical protein
VKCGGNEQRMTCLDDLDKQREIRHSAALIALMRDVVPIVALIAALAAIFWRVQGGH